MSVHACPSCRCDAPDLSDVPWRDHPLDEHNGRTWCPATAMVGPTDVPTYWIVPPMPARDARSEADRG